ncbi:MAG TPA: HEAT repeat domain-containing protein [Anaerolineaceae bacterium]|nr:HEAT repeat domain-containing protein [Anaerolineaceae bacterium]
MPYSKRSRVPFKQVVTDLLDKNKPFSPTHLHRFSDIDPADLASLRIAWPQVDLERRVSLMEDLEDLADSDTLVSFDDLARFALEDSDPRVRAVAIRLLWESDDSKLIPIFIKMMKSDPDEMVRAGAAGGLGMFVYLGELEEINSDQLERVENSLLAVYHGNDKPIVRRRALEALGYSGREEVSELIRTAFKSSDKDWQASALFAMGRSADESWSEYVLSRLNDPELEVRLEAVRAAGELELTEARLPLIEMVTDSEDLDVDLRAAAVWALSQIGGEGVRSALEKLSESIEDDDEAFFVDEALDNLDFKEGAGGFGLIGLTPKIDEEHTHIIDLSQKDELEEEGDEDEDLLYGSKN